MKQIYSLVLAAALLMPAIGDCMAASDKKVALIAGTADVIVEAIETHEPKVAYNSTPDAQRMVGMVQSTSEEELRARSVGTHK